MTVFFNCRRSLASDAHPRRPGPYRRLVPFGHVQGVDLGEREPAQLFVLLTQNGFVSRRLQATIRKNDNVNIGSNGVKPRVQETLRFDVQSQFFRDLTRQTRLWRLRYLELPSWQLPFVAVVAKKNYVAAADDNSLHRNGKAERVIIARWLQRHFQPPNSVRHLFGSLPRRISMFYPRSRPAVNPYIK